MDAISFDLSSQSNGWSFAPTRKTQSAFGAQGGAALHNTADTFAADIARRIGGTAMPESAVGNAEVAAEKENSVYGVTRGDLKALEKALAGMMDKIVEKFGVQAGGVAQALVYKKIGEDEITEENLGNGLLDALKFIDKQFGPEAGDELIAFMNNGINKELNAFFDNGHSEEFYVSTDAADAAAGKAAAGGQMLAGWMNKSIDTGGEMPSIMDVLKELAKDLEEKLRKGMENVSPDMLSGDISAQMAEQLEAYAAQTAPSVLVPGMVLEETV